MNLKKAAWKLAKTLNNLPLGWTQRRHEGLTRPFLCSQSCSSRKMFKAVKKQVKRWLKKKRHKNKQGSQTSPSITQKQCQPVTLSASSIFMHSKHKGSNPQRHMLRDPAESFYGVMSSRPIVINEPTHSHALPVNKFPR